MTHHAVGAERKAESANRTTPPGGASTTEGGHTSWPYESISFFTTTGIASRAYYQVNNCISVNFGLISKFFGSSTWFIQCFSTFFLVFTINFVENSIFRPFFGPPQCWNTPKPVTTMIAFQSIKTEPVVKFVLLWCMTLPNIGLVTLSNCQAKRGLKSGQSEVNFLR